MMALLSELKILIHVGQHLNILNLLGAVTKSIRFGISSSEQLCIKNIHFFFDVAATVNVGF